MTYIDSLAGEIKDSMRIRHDRLDAEIRRNIRAALADMEMRGVSVPEGDGLAGKACELYCKWQCGYMGKGEEYRLHYEGLRDSMSLSVGRRIMGDANSELFFPLLSHRLRSIICKCTILSKMRHVAVSMDFSLKRKRLWIPS